MVGVESDFVSSDFRHEIYQCLFEGRETVVVLEKSQFSKYGFAVSFEAGDVRVLSQP